jgi:hypothetical protein
LGHGASPYTKIFRFTKMELLNLYCATWLDNILKRYTLTMGVVAVAVWKDLDHQEIATFTRTQATCCCKDVLTYQ